MKKKILVIQPLHDKAMARLQACPDVVFDVITDVSPANLRHHVGGADAITVRDATLDATIIACATRAKVISRHGVGVDNVDLDACTRQCLPVAIVGSVNAVAVAEHTLFLLLAAARVGVVMDDAVRTGQFGMRAQVRSKELYGKTLLVVGYGRIGREVARRGAALGLRVVAFDPYAPQGADAPVAFAPSLDDALRGADVVSLHLPLNHETRGILDARRLGLLPKGAIVLNAGRGGLLDENALVRAIQSGALHGAGLDVFASEPLPADSPLVRERRIVLSPHCASLTEDTIIAMGMKTVENALAALEGRLDPALVVNKETLEAKP
ncbi:MAG: hydroxyacid dehydrogenase [Rhodobacteraceae bacterium]|nr:hydroxyacid dehydrogenase [Paracoccaceae bacterium]